MTDTSSHQYKAAPEGIYCDHGPSHLQLSSSGLLANKRLAVKDLFQLEGEKNTAGNPDWYHTHEVSNLTAASLQKILAEGAIFKGFTVTDEIAYSLQGNNIHYGSADNPHVPGHHCGGSSVGSAAAVANGFADIGLGTDTGGSVRVPASYCGLYGIRPTQGIISTAGLIGLAAPFDTVGWLTQEPDILAAVGEVLLPRSQCERPVNTLVICPEIMRLTGDETFVGIENYLPKLQARFDKVVVRHIAEGSLLPELSELFRVLQGRACAAEHREWLETTKPQFAPDVAGRFEQALAITDGEFAAARLKQKTWQREFDALIPDSNSVLLLPSTVTAAPKKGVDQTKLRQRLMNLTAIAGLTGSPQVHIPAFYIQEDGLKKPSGFSLLMRQNNDKNLLRLARELA